MYISNIYFKDLFSKYNKILNWSYNIKYSKYVKFIDVSM